MEWRLQRTSVWQQRVFCCRAICSVPSPNAFLFWCDGMETQDRHSVQFACYGVREFIDWINWFVLLNVEILLWFGVRCVADTQWCRKLFHRVSACVADSVHNQHKQMPKLIYHPLELVSCSLMPSRSAQRYWGERIEQVLPLMMQIARNSEVVLTLLVLELMLPPD